MSDAFGMTAAQQTLVREILHTAHECIEQVAVFGSRAQGTQRQNSDLDLVLYGTADEAVCDRLWTLFQESRLPFSVDVQSYTAIKHPLLRAHIDAVARPWLIRTRQGLEEKLEE
jgi:predicted nucleotidyltransferase